MTKITCPARRDVAILMEDSHQRTSTVAMSGPDENKPDNFFSRDWRERLDTVVELMKDISHHTDPLQVGNTYGKRMSNLFPASRRISMSRRDLDKPAFRITRDSTWTEQIDPWREKHRLPMISGGLLAELESDRGSMTSSSDLTMNSYRGSLES